MPGMPGWANRNYPKTEFELVLNEGRKFLKDRDPLALVFHVLVPGLDDLTVGLGLLLGLFYLWAQSILLQCESGLAIYTGVD